VTYILYNMAQINSLIGFWNNKSEEAEKRSTAKPRNENVRNRNWAKKDGLIPVEKAPVIKVEKRAEEYCQESDNYQTKKLISDEDSKKSDIGTSMEKTSIKSGNLTRPASLPSSPTPGRSSARTQSARLTKEKPVSPFLKFRQQ